MRFSFAALALLSAALVPHSAPVLALRTQSIAATSSIEGIVVQKGTSMALRNVDLELSRVEGTSAAPLSAAAADAFASTLGSTGQGFPSTFGTAPASVLEGEVKYGRTGADGRFVFRGLKEGKYRLVAVRVGSAFYPVEYGQRDLKQRGLNFPVAAGEAKKDIRLEMTPTGVITGRVVDEDRHPMGHVVVMALVIQYLRGERSAYIERTVLTDEQGDFRIYWLGPGSYYVAAVYEDPQRRTIDMAPSAPPGRTLFRHRATSPVVSKQVMADGSVAEEAYAVVYFGGTTELRNATPVEVRAGETFAGADIPMGAGKMRTHHIRGSVILGDTGQPAAGARVLAIPRQQRPNTLIVQGTTNASGAFDLSGALPDSYFVVATTPLSTTARVGEGPNPSVEPWVGGSSSGVGYLPVDLGNSDANNVRIVATGGITLPGHVTFEGKSPSESQADLARLIVGLTRDPDLIEMPGGLLPLPPPPPGTPRPAVSPPGNGQVTAAGDFRILMSPGDFRMNVDRLPPNTYVKSIRMGSDDVLRSGLHVSRASDNTIQIVIGSDGGTISGSIVDENSAPFLNATIALVPDSVDAGQRPDWYRNTTSDSSGNFQIRTVPPGNYKLYAWDWAEAGIWRYPDFIRTFETKGKIITVQPSSQHEKVQLNVIRTK
jgi:Carboxypeptidase regulatory-like domain